MMKRFICCSVLLIFVFTPALLKAQNITATLTGTVTDTSGAVVPGATITVHNNATDLDVRTLTTDTTGVYTVSQLAVGTYRVTVTARGFRNYVANEVILHVGDRRTLDVVLQVGQVTQEVTVTASAMPIESSSAAQGGTVTGTQIRELQLNNRNFEQLVLLQPGVSSTLPDQVGFGITNTSSISVNGARTGANNWTVDGSDVNDSGSNLTLLNVPSIDALQEFKIERSTYDAQYGRSAGGQINVITKAGTSGFHANAYEFIRNDALNTVPFLINSTLCGKPKIPGCAKKPPLRYNDFGYTIGGPIYIPNHYNADKSKTFFFWSEEWRRNLIPSTVTATLPPAQELTGNFQGLATLNPASAPAGCIANNQIAANCISANANAYIAAVYSKLTPNAPSNQLISSFIGLNNYRQEIGRLDQRITDKVQVFGRYIQDIVPTTEPGGLFANSPLPGVSSTSTNAPGRNVVAHVTMQLSPSIVNEVAYNYSWGAINSGLTGLVDRGSFKSSLTNLLPFSDPYGRVSGVSITGISGIAIPSAPYHERNIDKNIYDNLSMVRGNQTIRTGVSVQWMRKSENGPTATNGSFSFITSGGNPAFANFLLGNASTFTQANRDVIPDIHFINLEAYLQDDWKLRPNFTLNLGVRYGLLETPHDINGILTNFDPALFNAGNAPAIDPATGRFVAGGPSTPATYLNGVIVGGQNSPFGDRVNPNHQANFAPRLGFSWDPFRTGKTAVRGGYGIYYDRTLNGIWEQNQFTNPPVVATLSLSNASFDNPSTGTPPASILAPRSLRGTGTPNFAVPNNQQWNFSVQREIIRSTLLEVAYVGAKGTHLLGIYDLNQVPVSARIANPTVDANALRPYRGYRVISTVSPEFNSSYHSLQVSLNRRISNGLNMGVAYTWSKTLTDNTTDRSSASYNTYNRSLDRAQASYSRPTVFVVNYVYDLPFYRNQAGFAGHVLGGWEISGITLIESGVPLTIRQGTDPFNSLNGSGIGIDPSPVAPRPDLIANPHGQKTASKWFNTAAFQNATGHFGTSGRGILIGPGWNNWDFSIYKNTRISESFSTQFRVEFFNLFNHTSFSDVSVNTAAGTFGRVTATHDPRIIQAGLKLYF